MNTSTATMETAARAANQRRSVRRPESRFLSLYLCVLVCVFSLRAVCFAQDKEGAKEPPQLTVLRATFETRKQAILKPMLVQYQAELDWLQKTLAQNNDLEGALAVRKENESAAKQFYKTTSVPGGEAKEPQQLKILRSTYDSRKQFAMKPLLAQYEADLDRLEKLLAQSGDLEGALAVRKSRSSAAKPAPVLDQLPAGNLIGSIPVPAEWQR